MKSACGSHGCRAGVDARIHADAVTFWARRLEATGGEIEVLKRRPDSAVARVAVDELMVIVKFWRRQGLRAILRRLTHTSSPNRELGVLRTLHDAGVRVPRPMGHFRVHGCGYTDAVVFEDLGRRRRLVEHVHDLAAAGAEADLDRTEQALIDLTSRMLSLRVVDPDHGLHNMLVLDDGLPVRIDFEVARRVHSLALATGLYGQMLGRLLSSYTFAVQPRVARAEAFATGLTRLLRPPRRVRMRARAYVLRQLQWQREHRGIDTRICLDGICGNHLAS